MVQIASEPRIERLAGWANVARSPACDRRQARTAGNNPESEVSWRVTAVRLVEHGKPLEIQEIELPEPGDGDVVLEVAFSGVNPVDMYAAEGR